ncbi:hypothetical protein DERP_010509 [Dermatophagoides pteronyssinus]|uniref:Uncharacterized protein n=1 Tax=Dermatophagoides pteronyssinus TaxID=6956 RepID=A0ABQ8JFI8_DERPT|nr:hypothetical protein DERP_010509 [Dermatophagoides pteronyssinus]
MNLYCPPGIYDYYFIPGGGGGDQTLMDPFDLIQLNDQILNLNQILHLYPYCLNHLNDMNLIEKIIVMH